MRAAWQSSLGHFVTADPVAILSALSQFVHEPSFEQEKAWKQSIRIVQADGREVVSSNPQADSHGTLWEYELPREGGRRPDILFLQDAAILVIEFKNKTSVNLGDIDQVAAYARDLREYHSECQAIPVIPILLYLGKGPRLEMDGVILTAPNDFGKLVLEMSHKYHCRPPKVVMDKWLQGHYEPLPGIVAAARLLFDRQPLPFIRRAHSYGIPQTVDHILSICEEARATHRHHLVLLTGVPGSGKTLVGLQVVHSDRLCLWLPEDKKYLNPASFLSGNGPLVAVLQDALKSKSFVQDMHRFIREYGILDQAAIPHERVIVFDEAQRAWTGDKIKQFYGKKGIQADKSEPEMLIHVSQRMKEGCVILALIGSGQEIHTGEESGIQGWIEAVIGGGQCSDWTIHVPPSIGSSFSFQDLTTRTTERLDLNKTLRSHAAERLHEWVNQLLDDPAADEKALSAIAKELQNNAFPLLLTRDLAWAQEYARSRFEGESNRRFGLLASSKARNLGAFGVDNRYDRFFSSSKWFNEDPQHKQSCCGLIKPAQEFHCQGLELDLPIICWGDDFWWQDKWVMRPSRVNPLVKDPFAFRKNTYRVLLTRGREGMVIFVPPNDILMDATAQKLIRCGAMPVETRLSKVGTPTPLQPVLLSYADVKEIAFKTALPLIAELAAGPFADGFRVASLEESLEVQWVKVSESLGGPNRFIVKATGTSMEPGIKEGDWLVFEYHRTPRRDGQIVIVDLSAVPDASPESAIKRIYQKTDKWIITSDNPEYTPLLVSRDEIFYPILGVFVGTLSTRT